MEHFKIADRIISLHASLLEALKLMDSNKVKLLFVFDDLEFIGILTIGDLQRAIINNIQLNQHISEIIDKNKVYVNEYASQDEIKKKMLALRAECMPVVNLKDELVDVHF